jgi:hypothetical protein
MRPVGRPGCDGARLGRDSRRLHGLPGPGALAADAEDAAASGFSVKTCIHPSQVPVAGNAFRAGENQAAGARRVFAAARGREATAVDGQTIDAPLIRQAGAVPASSGRGSGARMRGSPPGGSAAHPYAETPWRAHLDKFVHAEACDSQPDGDAPGEQRRPS